MSERIQQLDRIRYARTDGSFEAGDEAYNRISLYDDKQKGPAWNENLDQPWHTFSKNAGSKGRLGMTKYEWRYLLERAGGVSMVTGLPFGWGGRHIDRVFNTDTYCLKNCLIMEGSLIYAKGYMAIFQDSQGVARDKGRFGNDILRRELDRQEQATRPHGASKFCCLN